MSMIGCFRTTSDADLEALRRRPNRILRLVHGAEAQERGGLFGFLRRRDDWSPQDPGTEIDVDKAWHGIHFLLTGNAHAGKGPLAFILEGGRSVGGIDVGYGPARVFSSQEVKAIAAALDSIERSDLESRCNAAAFFEEEIYPEIWDEPPEECFGYLFDYYEDLRQFVVSAAARDRALIVYLS